MTIQESSAGTLALAFAPGLEREKYGLVISSRAFESWVLPELAMRLETLNVETRASRRRHSHAEDG
jgi:hypothetical protein